MIDGFSEQCLVSHLELGKVSTVVYTYAFRQRVASSVSHCGDSVDTVL